MNLLIVIKKIETSAFIATFFETIRNIVLAVTFADWVATMIFEFEGHLSVETIITKINAVR